MILDTSTLQDPAHFFMSSKIKVFILQGVMILFMLAPKPYTDFDYWIGINRFLDYFVNTEYATGLDVSKHRGDLKINLDDPKIQEIIDFIIIRAGYVGFESGQLVQDEHFAQNYQYLVDHPGILRGSYWYLSSELDWELQLIYFEGLIRDKDFDFLAVDFEEIYNNMSPEFGRAAVDMLLELKKRHPETRIFIYTHQYHYNLYLSQHEEISRFPYWSADYPLSLWSGHEFWWMQKQIQIMLSYGRPPIPKARMSDDWDIWQFGDRTGMGELLGLETLHVDMNRTRLPEDEFIEFIGAPDRWEFVTNNSEFVTSRLEYMDPDLQEIYIDQESQDLQCSYFLFDQVALCLDGYPCSFYLKYHAVERSEAAYIQDLFYIRSDRLETTYDRIIQSVDNYSIMDADLQLLDLDHVGLRYVDQFVQVTLQIPARIRSELLVCESN